MAAIDHAQFTAELADALEEAGLSFDRNTFTMRLTPAITDWLGVNVSRPVLADRVVRVLARLDGAVVGEGEPDAELGGLIYFDLTGMMLYARTDQGAWDTGRTLGGDPGREVELQTTATHIQWRYEGDANWTDLVELSTLKGADGQEVSLQKSGTHIQWRLGDGAWADLVALATLKGADGQEVSFQKSATHIQWRLGDGAWADLVALATLKGDEGADAYEVAVAEGFSGSRTQWLASLVGDQGPQGEGLHIDVSAPFSERPNYEAEPEGFIFASTDGADGLGGLAVLYVREGVSGWGDPVTVQGTPGAPGADGNALSLEGFVPYATIITGSGDLVPGAAVHFIGLSEAVLALDVTTPAMGDLYPLSNGGTANMQIDPGAGGGHIQLGSMSAGDRLTLTPGDGVTLVCSNLTGPVFTEYQEQ